jgi:hypothetical protein
LKIKLLKYEMRGEKKQTNQYWEQKSFLKNWKRLW